MKITVIITVPGPDTKMWVFVFGTMTTHPPISISQCDICNVFGLTCVTTQDVTLLPCEARENVQPEVMEQEIKVG